MAYRNSRGYGQSYGAFGSDQVDPLAAAIMGALGAGTQMFETVRGVRMENADRKAAAARQAALDKQNEDRYQQGRQDQIDAENRAVARETDRESRATTRENAKYLRDRGISVVPRMGPNGTVAGTGYAKVAPTDDELATAVAERQRVEVLRQQAKALGIPNAEQMTRGELEVLTGEAANRRKSDAEFKDFQQREAYSDALARGRAAFQAGLRKPESILRPLPAQMAEKQGSYRALIGTADDALTKFDKAAGVDPTTGKPTKAVTGMFDALRSTKAVRQLGQTTGLPLGLDAEGISATAALSNLASSIMKDRSGGAITPQEFVRLEPFLPSKFEDEEKNRQNLIDLRAELERIHEERLNALEASGYDVSHLRWRGGGSEAPAASGDAYDQQASDWLARRRKGTR